MTDDTASCARCDSPIEGDDLRCPICSQAVPVGERSDPSAPKVEVLRCNGCGAAVSYSAKAGAPKCAFCGSVMHLETPSDPMEQTRRFLPFTPPQNVSGAPAVSLPLGRTLDGMPIGVMFAARLGEDEKLLELSLQIEQADAFVPGLL